MNKKLSKEAIDELTTLLNKVKEIVHLLKDMGIQITSDPWTATSFDSSENILVWKKEDFEKINENIDDGDIFYIGGNVITGGQHQYKNKWINAPKELAEIQGKIFEKYLQSIINSTSLKHFKLELKNPYGLTDNCGWENWFVIETTVQESALINIKEIQTINIKELGEEIAEECILNYGEDLNIDNIYESVTYELHDGIKADIIYFAFKYLDENNIKYQT